MVLTALMLCFIWGNSLLPESVSGAISGFAKDIINALMGTVGDNQAVLSGDGVLRKIAHGTSFAVLGVLQMLLRQDLKQHKNTLALTGLSVALIDETIQLFVNGRAGLVKDIWIDFGGFMFGCILVYGIMRLSSRKRAQSDHEKKA